jgi:acetate kinase
MRLLIVNAGSSSVKLRVLDAGDQVVASRDLPALSSAEPSDALASFVTDEAHEVRAVAHRIVHGGSDFDDAVVVDDAVREELDTLAELAPLHVPPALTALDAVRRLRPDLQVVACFDTTFHRTLPDEAAVYALPWEWTEQWGVRRFGFHGLSHRYASRRAAQLLSRRPAGLRVVTCHLGSGASLAAVHGGVSVDTTMGFTPLDGLMMGTRSGAVDPGGLLWIQRRHGVGVAEMEDALDRHSGLLGVSGRSADMREVIAAANDGDERAALAVRMFVHRVRTGVAAMAAAMGGLDAVVFTGGIGEGSPLIREQVCAGLAFLGVELDAAADHIVARDDADLSRPHARVRVLLVHAREDVEMARDARRLLGTR